jgi:carboxypeptidase Taq
LQDETWEKFSARMRELSHLGAIGQLMGWDEQTMMPPKAAPGRAGQTGTLAAVTHEKLTSSEYGNLIEELGQQDLDADKAAMVALAKRDRDMAVKLPAKLVRDLAETASAGQVAWQEARSQDDYSLFEPLLNKMFTLKAQQAEALGYEKEPYDAHLDLFERGATAEMLQPMFDSVTEGLAPTIWEARSRNGRIPGLPEGTYDVDRVLGYCRDLLGRMGYDLEAGRLDLSAHPFTCGLGPRDARVTTRVTPDNPQEAILATLHEMGHGQYQLGIREDWAETAIGEPVSLGVHESQSRLWENHVGRSLAFWEGELPNAQVVLEPWRAESPMNIYKAINRVEPSLIRVQADEVTYPLHIAVRFELELAICRGDLTTAELPGAWKEAYQRHLGVTPRTYADGVLQDVHWSLGYLGYFPTYLIGSVYAAALFDAATTSLGGSDVVDQQFREGQFQPLLDWLRREVHALGSLRLPAEIIAEATGKPMTEGIDTEPFVSYIKRKYSALYA